MAKKEIRTKYIKSLVADKDAMAKVLAESTKDSLSTLLDESVNRSLRQMLAESDNDSYEEEVTTDKPDFDSEPEMNQDGGDAAAEGGEPTAEGGEDEINLDLGSGEEGAEGCENGECADGAEGDDVWAGLEDCMDSDGEYDLRGKDIESVINILKTIEQMAPDTDVRIIKNSDDTIEVEGGEDGAGEDIDNGGENAEPNEFEGEMGSEMGAMDGDDGMDAGDNGMDAGNEGQGGDDETYFELELDDNDETQNDDMVNEGNVNLGYTDNYQNKSAMTMPNDKGEGEGDSRFDGGAPTGGANNKKRWVGHDGQNNGNPYSQKTKQPMTEETNECGAGCSAEECNEEAIFEIDLGNSNSTNTPDLEERYARGQAVDRKTGMTHARDNDTEEKTGRNVRIAPKGQVKGTGEGVNESRMAQINRQANTIMAENKELKDIAAQLKQQLSEAVLINASLAKVIRLVTENATSRDEKINILNRFNKVQSLNECKSLYNQISAELAKAHTTNNNLLNKQLTEAKGQNKNMIVETNMLNQSEDLRQMLDLNERLMRLGK